MICSAYKALNANTATGTSPTGPIMSTPNNEIVSCGTVALNFKPVTGLGEQPMRKGDPTTIADRNSCDGSV
ncbi:hypothetical protein GWI33_020285 [Rhynchophorus ferrugineus]|uniref:Uncharacterized protein n=1 Tax=Rhynchophorus ferrugineus TaxID=354439 RepID=A0A834M3J7_RHYFE|nr:hypothetical protein GWI33_020285 [Rhynchophorus ferrugineus]